MSYNEILKETVTSIKYCQRAVLCTSDGLLTNAFPETDSSLNEALSASATSILGITSSVTERAGKTGNDYVLIKNQDSFLLVFFLENHSLFLIADSDVNLGLLLHKGKKLRTAIAEKIKDEPSVPESVVSFETTDEKLVDAVSSDESDEVIFEPEITHHEPDLSVETVEESQSQPLDVDDNSVEISDPDEIIELIEIEEEIESTEREIENPDEIISLVEKEESVEEESEEAIESESDGDVPFEPTHETDTSDDQDKIEFRFSDETEEDTEEEKSSANSEFLSYDSSTDAIKIVYESDDEKDVVDDDETETSSETTSNKTNIMDLSDTNEIEQESDGDKDKSDGFQSFISWRERLQKEKESWEKSDDDNSARDLFDGI